jgi:hypothetical protein
MLGAGPATVKRSRTAAFAGRCSVEAAPEPGVVPAPLRAIGVTPFTLPMIDEVSARVAGRAWAGIVLCDLEALDVIACLELFERQQQMTRTGIFRPIAPLAMG